RRTPIAQGPAFQAIYRVFLDKKEGPPAGALMSVLPRDLVLARLAALPFDEAALWEETAVTEEQLQAALAKEKDKIARVSGSVAGDGRAEIEVVHQDGKTFVHRVKSADAAGVVARAAR